MDLLLEGKSLSPKLFVTYLRMIKLWQDIQVKCNELVIKMKFGKDNELPEWAGKGVGPPSKIVVVERDEALDGTDLEDIANADHVFIPIIRKP